MLLTLCVLLSEWCVRFGVGMLVPLQDAAAGCCCQIFLRSSRGRSVARGKWLQRKGLTKHKFWSCKRTKVQNWEVWGVIRVWFGHDSGYDSETIFFWIEEDLLLESLLPTVKLLRLLLNGCNGSTCQTTLDRTWIWRMWSYMRMYDLYPPACRRLFWMFFSCTFSSATLRLMFLFDGFLVWLPASQPATSGVILLISLISNTASSQPRSQPAATSQPYSQPPNRQQQLSQPPSQPASQPASQKPEPASLG